MKTINHDLVEIALEKTNGHDFEVFINNLCSSIFGSDFIPLGGYHDGGADAFLDNIYEFQTQPEFFIQSSIVDDYSSKISNTIRRLSEFGRTVKCLYYFTPNDISNVDIIEDKLSIEYGIIIKIRDKKWIISKINDSESTISSYINHLEKYTYFLKSIGSTSLSEKINTEIPDQVLLFLSKEIDDVDYDEKILFKLCDGLILWSLEETDPECYIFMTKEDIEKKIYTAVPKIEIIIKGIIQSRLDYLSKVTKKERQIRFHSKANQYCLSYEIRKKIYDENISDEKLLIDIKQLFTNRIKSFSETITDEDAVIGADICLKTIQKMFQDEGYQLTLSTSSNTDIKSKSIASDLLDQYISESSKLKSDPYEFKNCLIENLRNAFYESHQIERDLFRRYSILYTLLFTINTDPKVLEYFQNMKSELNIYVGSDILIRSLSERYLDDENQTTRNALKIIKEAGGKLNLSEPIFEEVYFHLRNTNYEYINNFHTLDNAEELYLLENSDRILIRAYAYARKLKRVSNWEQYINNFCNYQNLLHDNALDEFKKYLIFQFKLNYESKESLSKYFDKKELYEITERLKEYKKNDQLAENDAMMALSIYGIRDKLNEISSLKEYGYSTWWLTHETAILSFTKELVNKKNSRYMMRPEFIIKYMAFSPKYNEVKKMYNSIFPSIMGIKLVRRIDPEIITKLISKVGEINEIEEGRKLAKIHELSDKLKSDFKKYYSEHHSLKDFKFKN